jgi:REP element-mobilizing transposase RayT
MKLQFKKGGVYHIYNAGCGRQAIFFQKRNYAYFKNKIIEYILPYADILDYKLNVNEIHLLIAVKQLSRYVPERNRMRTLAESIGIMLRSYAQAINKQEKRKGVLWQGPTKAELEERFYNKRPYHKNPKAKKSVKKENLRFEAAGQIINHKTVPRVEQQFSFCFFRKLESLLTCFFRKYKLQPHQMEIRRERYRAEDWGQMRR